MADGAPAPAAARRPLRRRLRAWLAWLHLWIGLTAGTAFALVALAGTVLVFHVELVKFAHPALAAPAPAVDARVLGAIVDEWTPRGLRALDLPRADLPVWQGYLQNGDRVYFAPDDGRLLLVRDDSDPLMFLHHWHVELLGGPVGKEVLGVVGWLALALLLGGLYLWWPALAKLFAHLRWHRGPPARRWLTWHRSTGAVLLPLLVLATLTGTGMVYSAGFRAVLVAALGGAPTPAPPRVDASTGTTPDWPAVLARAREAGIALRRLSVPDGTGVVAWRGQAAGEWHPVGRSTVLVTTDGTEVLARFDATADRPGARLSNAIYPLHTGVAGGWPLRLATAIAGIAPTFLLVTGFLFWRRRRGR